MNNGLSLGILFSFYFILGYCIFTAANKNRSQFKDEIKKDDPV